MDDAWKKDTGKLAVHIVHMAVKNKAMGFSSHSFFSCRFWAVSVVHIGAYMWAYFAF